MGGRDTADDALAARRRFVRRLRAHENVRSVDFSRDGFRLVRVALEPDAEFHDQWHRRATQLGYTVEQLEVGESPPDWPENTWVLRLAQAEASADQSTWSATVRNTIARLVQALRDRLRK